MGVFKITPSDVCVCLRTDGFNIVFFKKHFLTNSAVIAQLIHLFSGGVVKEPSGSPRMAVDEVVARQPKDGLVVFFFWWRNGQQKTVGVFFFFFFDSYRVEEEKCRRSNVSTLKS